LTLFYTYGTKYECIVWQYVSIQYVYKYISKLCFVKIHL